MWIRYPLMYCCMSIIISFREVRMRYPVAFLCVIYCINIFMLQNVVYGGGGCRGRNTKKFKKSYIVLIFLCCKMLCMEEGGAGGGIPKIPKKHWIQYILCPIPFKEDAQDLHGAAPTFTPLAGGFFYILIHCF